MSDTAGAENAATATTPPRERSVSGEAQPSPSADATAPPAVPSGNSSPEADRAKSVLERAAAEGREWRPKESGNSPPAAAPAGATGTAAAADVFARAAAEGKEWRPPPMASLASMASLVPGRGGLHRGMPAMMPPPPHSFVPPIYSRNMRGGRGGLGAMGPDHGHPGGYVPGGSGAGPGGYFADPSMMWLDPRASMAAAPQQPAAGQAVAGARFTIAPGALKKKVTTPAPTAQPPAAAGTTPSSLDAPPADPTQKDGATGVEGDSGADGGAAVVDAKSAGAPPKQLVERVLVVVEFKRRRLRKYDATFKVACGMYVIAEDDRGLDMGVVVRVLRLSSDLSVVVELLQGTEVHLDKPIVRDGRLVREATARERHVHQVWIPVLEQQALNACRLRAQYHNLNLSVVDCEYRFDGQKVTFFYDSSVVHDFRELVKDLFALFKARIWMENVNGLADAPTAHDTPVKNVMDFTEEFYDPSAAATEDEAKTTSVAARALNLDDCEPGAAAVAPAGGPSDASGPSQDAADAEPAAEHAVLEETNQVNAVVDGGAVVVADDEPTRVAEPTEAAPTTADEAGAATVVADDTAPVAESSA